MHRIKRFETKGNVVEFLLFLLKQSSLSLADLSRINKMTMIPAV